MHGLQILDCRGAAYVEEVLANPTVACATALATTQVSEAVFDADTLAKACSPGAGLGELAQALLQELVVSNGHGAASAWCRGRALIPQRTAVAGVGIELDVVADIYRLDLACRTRDGAFAQVELEIRL